MVAIEKGDDLDYIKHIIESGVLAKHAHINTIERLSHIITDMNGPSLRDAMTHTRYELQQKKSHMKELPLNDEEAQIRMLEEAIAYYKAGEAGEAPQGPLLEEDTGPFGEEPLEEPPSGPSPEGAGAGAGAPVCRILNGANYSWYQAVWYRIEASLKLLAVVRKYSGNNKLLDWKVRCFREAHLKAIQYLDSLEDPTDEAINVAHLCSLYVPLGESTYADDRDLARRINVQTIRVARTPLEVLREAYPHLRWRPEEIPLEERQLADVGLEEGDYVWHPFPDAPLETHSIMYACIFILNQTRMVHSAERNAATRHAARVYYAGFVELFLHCCKAGRMDDEYLLTPIGSTRSRLNGGTMSYSDALTPWELYGMEAERRAFHAGDLPDLFHVINSIPLWGEQDTPPYSIGKMYQKSFPFACQRRHLIKLIVSTIDEDEAVWRLFSQLFWVMLSGLYPDDLQPNTAPCMRTLMRAKELTGSKQLLVEALKPVSTGGPLVVFVAFRLHILYMASLNPTYVAGANECIDWDYFKSNTMSLFNIICDSSILPDDPFEQARKELSKTIKSPNSRVHRLRRHSEVVAITEHMNTVLEKTIIKDKHQKAEVLVALKRIELTEDATERMGAYSAYMDTSGLTIHDLAQHIRINEGAARMYEKLLTLACKANILNILIRLPPEDRMTVKAFSLLTLPQYGGIAVECVESMCKLVRIYRDKAIPNEFVKCIDAIKARYFIVACFYFNMVAVLEKISFVPLDAETVKRTDRAMLTRRYHVYPGQVLPLEKIYSVTVALCCEKVCNLLGQGKFGDTKVAYNMECQAYVCVGQKNRITDGPEGAVGEGEDDADDPFGVVEDPDEIANAATQRGRGQHHAIIMDARKAIRNERKQFNKVPCGQPVLTISLRGRALIWGNRLENLKQYMFCPGCGALHIYTSLNFSNADTGQYRCDECAKNEPRKLEHRRCAYCDRTTAGQMSENYKLAVTHVTPPPEGGGDPVQWLYFCRGHYNIARRFNYKLTKEPLWKIINDIEHKKLLDAARRFG